MAGLRAYAPVESMAAYAHRRLLSGRLHADDAEHAGVFALHLLLPRPDDFHIELVVGGLVGILEDQVAIGGWGTVVGRSLVVAAYDQLAWILEPSATGL